MIRNDSQQPEEQEIARLLRAAGRRPGLPEALKDSWEARFRAELEPVVERRKQRRLRTLAGLCATAAILVVTVGLSLRQPAPPELFIRVSHVDGATLQQRDGTVLPLEAGYYLRTGSAVSTAAGGHAAIDFAGYDLRLNSGTRVEIGALGITLHAGEVYASDEGSNTQLQQLAITTPQGIVRDIGTQFLVSLRDDLTVVTVRSGAVTLATDTGEYRARAQADSAGRLTVAGARDVRSDTLPRSSVDWRWIYRAGPEFLPEGKSIHDFLSWSAREAGLHLDFASEGARIHALTNFLYGSLPAKDPDAMVADVLASTDLVAQRVGSNVLRVELRRRE